MASEDPALDEFTDQQAKAFSEMSELIISSLSYPVIKHLLNTSGIARHSHLQFDMVRMGIRLYGIDSSNKLDLKEVSTLRSAIAQIKELKAGESVSYGRSGKVNKDSRIAHSTTWICRWLSPYIGQWSRENAGEWENWFLQ